MAKQKNEKEKSNKTENNFSIIKVILLFKHLLFTFCNLTMHLNFELSNN